MAVLEEEKAKLHAELLEEKSKPMQGKRQNIRVGISRCNMKPKCRLKNEDEDEIYVRNTANRNARARMQIK